MLILGLNRHASGVETMESDKFSNTSIRVVKVDECEWVYEHRILRMNIYMYIKEWYTVQLILQ